MNASLMLTTKEVVALTTLRFLSLSLSRHLLLMFMITMFTVVMMVPNMRGPYVLTSFTFHINLASRILRLNLPPRQKEREKERNGQKLVISRDYFFL